ncbi:hypothetical protein IAE37_000926 [Pseudomonas sp. S31]|uniref:hypothetical protein n=1 Tax=Pseudomonas sp. S31 TaxID=1564473 RepID=UPI001911EAD5|nr:hypothetical protein [Pseudomonas sp. S31]MBK4998650.1 hypothetical protein [Pseudomonas sp. S31]
MTENISSNRNSAAVIEQSLMAFGAGIEVGVRADIKHAFHFATLAASKQYPDQGQTEQWFKLFLQVMQDCGWVTLSRSYERESSASQSLKLGAVAYKSIKVIGQAVFSNPISDALAELAAKALEALGEVTEAQDILKRNMRERQISTVGLGACVQNASGEVLLVISAVDAKPLDDHELDTVAFEWKSTAAQMYTGSAVLVFHREVFDTLRETIAERVGERARRNVLDYEI